MHIDTAASGNRRERRRTSALASRGLFELGFERLSYLAEVGPFSLPTLMRHAEAGLLVTGKLGGARIVTKENWSRYIANATADAGLVAEVA